MSKNLVKKLSLIVSVYNEEEALESFYNEALRYLKKLGREYEILFVNDGSIDGSREILDSMAAADKNVKIIHFSRNFGHEAAMMIEIGRASCRERV